ncbi:hypothetical protein G6F24_018929 [Rhizopus arrhizus]|nr:hypothetical protein G6F24_018929 [Rhizopus arrhizus]
MATPDLNLLITLDVLLAEGSVARAARRWRRPAARGRYCPAAAHPRRPTASSAGSAHRNPRRSHAPQSANA